MTANLILGGFAVVIVGSLIASAVMEWIARQYQAATDGYAASFNAAEQSARAYCEDDLAEYMIGMATSEILAADAGRIMERADRWARRLAPWVLPDDKKDDSCVHHR